MSKSDKTALRELQQIMHRTRNTILNCWNGGTGRMMN